MFYTNKRLRRRDQANRLEKQNHKLRNVEKNTNKQSHRLLTRDDRPPTHKNMKLLMHSSIMHLNLCVSKWSDRIVVQSLNRTHSMLIVGGAIKIAHVAMVFGFGLRQNSGRFYGVAIYIFRLSIFWFRTVTQDHPRAAALRKIYLMNLFILWYFYLSIGARAHKKKPDTHTLPETRSVQKQNYLRIWRMK